jgi:AcrR family transcriptional regulator
MALDLGNMERRKRAPRKARPGRRIGSGGASKGAIIEAAKELFAARGFRGTTTREIAKLAGVDMALVHYFFGTKAELFARVIDVPLPAAQIAELIGKKDDRGAGERLARFYLETMFIENGSQITSMLRAALGDPESIPTLRKLLQEGVVRDAAALLSGRSAKLKAELVGAIVVGLFICRHMMQLEPLASAPVKNVVAAIAPALQAVLGGAAARPARSRRRPRSKDS